MASKDWKLVHEVFTAALRRDPEERDGFLDHSCTGRLWLRAEVGSLLAAHARAGDFSEAPSPASATRSIGDNQPHAVPAVHVKADPQVIDPVNDPVDERNREFQLFAGSFCASGPPPEGSRPSKARIRAIANREFFPSAKGHNSRVTRFSWSSRRRIACCKFSLPAHLLHLHQESGQIAWF